MIFCLSYDPKLKTWLRTNNTEQATTFRISAASGDGKGFMGFQRYSSIDQMYVNLHDGKWIQPHQDLPGLSTDTPTMVVLDGYP